MRCLTLVSVVVVVCAALIALAAEDPITMKGHFNWNKQKDQEHDLNAAFTPTGENAWDVVFDFKWKGKPMRYEGEARGSLESGSFEGAASTDGGKRRWIYSGKADAGTINCKHTQVMRGGKEQSLLTGNFTISR
jgi:hypothetical protein